MKLKSYKDRTKSPYAKYGKAPYRYSDTVRELNELVKSKGSTRTTRGNALRKEHAVKFGYSRVFIENIMPDEGERA